MNENIPVNVFVAQSSATTYTYNASTPEEVTAPNQVSDTLTSAEAAATLGVTMNNLRQIVFKRRLTPVGKAGRKNLFSRADVAQIAEARKARAAERED